MKDLSSTSRWMVAGILYTALVAAALYAQDLGPLAGDPKTPQQKAQDQTLQKPKNVESIGHDPKQGPSARESRSDESTSKAVRSLILTVKLALLADQRTARSSVEVEINGQEATLSGKVSSEMEKAASKEVAHRVDGVTTVVNKLEVDDGLHQTMMRKRDEIISEYIAERFKKSATLEAAKFGIKTENGVVELSGKTRFQVIVLEAAEVARQVPGVKAVKTTAVRLEGVE